MWPRVAKTSNNNDCVTIHVASVINFNQISYYTECTLNFTKGSDSKRDTGMDVALESPRQATITTMVQ